MQKLQLQHISRPLLPVATPRILLDVSKAFRNISMLNDLKFHPDDQCGPLCFSFFPNFSSSMLQTIITYDLTRGGTFLVRTVHIVRTSSTWYCTLTPGLFLLQCEGVKYLGRQCINMQGKGWDVKEGSSRRDLKREDRSRRPLLLMTS